MKLASKIILITGAAAGVGRELALQAARQHATVACIDYNGSGLAETGELLQAAGAHYSLHQVDISCLQQVQALANELIDRHGHVDILINNAGIMQPFATIPQLPLDQMQRIMDVNYWGTVYMVKTFLPLLAYREQSHIVNISSMGGLFPFPSQTAYSASKAAIKVFTEGLRAELRQSRTGITLVYPGAMDTGMVNNAPDISDETKAKLSDAGGIGLKPDKAAQKILQGLEKEKTRLLLGVDAVVLDKLYRLMPNWTVSLLAWAMSKSPVHADLADS